MLNDVRQLRFSTKEILDKNLNSYYFNFYHCNLNHLQFRPNLNSEQSRLWNPFFGQILFSVNRNRPLVMFKGRQTLRILCEYIYLINR